MKTKLYPDDSRRRKEADLCVSRCYLYTSFCVFGHVMLGGGKKKEKKKLLFTFPHCLLTAQWIHAAEAWKTENNPPYLLCMISEISLIATGQQ